MKTKFCAWIVVLGATVTALTAAFAPGGVAYTKRIETALLAEPQMLAAPVARLAYDERFLYVGFECDDPEPGQIRAPFTERDRSGGDAMESGTRVTAMDGMRRQAPSRSERHA